MGFFDPVSYLLGESLAESAVQTIAELSQSAEARLNAFADILRSRAIYKNVYGNGVINVRDAAAERINYIQVDSELAGQTLYVQISNASGMTEAQAEADDNGYATVNLSTVSGENRFYITTLAYAFPPTGDGEHGELNGVYVNPRTNENGVAVYDSIRLTNGVHAVLHYRADFERYAELANEPPIERVLAASGKGVRYDVAENPLSPEFMDDFFYMKLDGYPYGTQEKPTYVITSYPNPDCQVYYVRRLYDLTE